MPQPTAIGRLKATLGGLFLTAFLLGFTVFGIGMVVKSAYQLATYLPAAAVVDKITCDDDTSDEVSMAYSFSVNGESYTAVESANSENESIANELRQYKVGERLTIYHDPYDPAMSQRSVTVETGGLAIAIVLMPFIFLGFNQLSLGLLGKELIRSRQPNAQSSSVPGGGLFWAVVGMCAAGALAQAAFSQTLFWPWSLATGLTILFVAIPAALLWAIRLAKRSSAAKEAKLRKLRNARQTDRAAGKKDNPDLDVEKYLMNAGSLRKKLAAAIAFTFLWWCIISPTAFVAIYSIVKHETAQWRFVSTQGVVLSSKVRTSTVRTSRESNRRTNFEPRIRYRYTVAGREYNGDQYTFPYASTRDCSSAKNVVNENPPGKIVTVYYAPDDPSQSVLNFKAPGLAYFFLLFLQPFLLAGFVAIGWCVNLPAEHRKTIQFLRTEASPSPNIPGWGVIEQDIDGFLLGERRSPLAPLSRFFIGYGIACFIAVFVVAILFLGFCDPNVLAIRWAFIIAACVGVAAMLKELFLSGRSSHLFIDTTRKRLQVRFRRRNYDVPLADVQGLRLRRITYPGRMRVNGENTRQLMLEAVIRSGDPIPLHAFKWQAGNQAHTLAVTAKAQRLLAQLIGCPVIAPDDNNAPS